MTGVGTRFRGWPRTIQAGFAVLSVFSGVPQQESRERLPAAKAVLDEPFVRVGSVRELSDGRVLIADQRANRVVVGDLQANSVRAVGAAGRGPNEYTRVGQLIPLAADSTLLIDVGGRRWLVLYRDAVVETVPPDSPALRNGASIPAGADTRGNVLAVRSVSTRRVSGRVPPDSHFVVTVSRDNGGADTVASLRSRSGTTIVRNGTTAVRFNPLSAGELAIMFPDGWVAIARLDPYRVDWSTPERRSITGPPILTAPPLLNEREKLAFMRRWADESGGDVKSADIFSDWPRTVPPFLPNSLMIGTDGRLWIARVPSADHEYNSYDVVTRRGVVEQRYVVGLQERIVGVGQNSIFTVMIDADGFERLRRHHVPSR